jgi:hypothetical protein
MKSAVEWFANELRHCLEKNGKIEITPTLLDKLEQQAKEMEKEQSLKMPTYNLNELADEYYKQFDNLPVVRYNAYVAGFKKAMELLTFKQQEQ